MPPCIGWLEHFGVKPATAAKDRERRQREAIQYALQRGSRSGRVAWQFARGYAGARSLAKSVGAIEGVSGIVRVAAAVILRPDGRVLLAQRPPGKPYEGYWEFPGGKLEPRRDAARRRSSRELHEELGLAVRRAAPWIVQEFVYPHAHVELNFFRVFEWDGEPHGHDGQAFAWQTPGAFDVAPLLPANTRVLAALRASADLRDHVARASSARTRSSQRARSGVRRRAQDSCRSARRTGRRHAWPLRAAREGARARRHGAKVLAQRRGSTSRASSASMAFTGPPRGCSKRGRDPTTCSSAPRVTMRTSSRALRRSAAISQSWDPCDRRLRIRAVQPLGWDGFAHQIDGTRIPVYALGGL